MFCKKMFTKKFLVGAVCGAILSAAILVGCTGDTKPEGGRDIDRAEVTQVMPERGGSEPAASMAAKPPVPRAVVNTAAPAAKAVEKEPKAVAAAKPALPPAKRAAAPMPWS